MDQWTDEWTNGPNGVRVDIPVVRCNVRNTRVSGRVRCNNPEASPTCHPLHTPAKHRGLCDYCRSWRCPICRVSTELADLRFDPFMVRGRKIRKKWGAYHATLACASTYVCKYVTQ